MQQLVHSKSKLNYHTGKSQLGNAKKSILLLYKTCICVANIDETLFVLILTVCPITTVPCDSYVETQQLIHSKSKMNDHADKSQLKVANLSSNQRWMRLHLMNGGIKFSNWCMHSISIVYKGQPIFI